MLELKDLTKKKISEIVDIANELGIDSSGKKNEIIEKIIDHHLEKTKKNDDEEKKPVSYTHLTLPTNDQV